MRDTERAFKNLRNLKNYKILTIVIQNFMVFRIFFLMKHSWLNSQFMQFVLFSQFSQMSLIFSNFSLFLLISGSSSFVNLNVDLKNQTRIFRFCRFSWRHFQYTEVRDIYLIIQAVPKNILIDKIEIILLNPEQIKKWNISELKCYPF